MCDFSVQEVVTKRYSVRTFDKRPVDKEIRQNLLLYAASLHNPWGPKARIQFIEKATSQNGEKLGTYGTIKGANLYLGVTIPDEEYALEALGYEFEQLVLYATSLGLGTCWLGGTFNRSAFSAAIEIRENEIFPILSPLGYPAEKKSFREQVMRRSIKADGRLPWNELFYKNSFDEPLSEEAAGDYRFPLAMLRLAPSAVNKQPWRVVITDSAVHFFKKNSLATGTGSVDMQRMDVGIAICHFDLAVQERNIVGHFEKQIPNIVIPEGMTYVISWIKE